jgi:hypothetical protein
MVRILQGGDWICEPNKRTRENPMNIDGLALRFVFVGLDGDANPRDFANAFASLMKLTPRDPRAAGPMFTVTTAALSRQWHPKTSLVK